MKHSKRLRGIPPSKPPREMCAYGSAQARAGHPERMRSLVNAVPCLDTG